MSETNNGSTNDNQSNDEQTTPAAQASDTGGSNARTPGGVPAPQSQRERWLKYGGNVAVVSLVAVALAALVTYAAERKPVRLDTTAMGLYSLKPQTIKIIKNLKSPVRLVSLYTKSKPPQGPDEDADAKPAQVPPEEAAQTVNDLLNEYASKGNNITTEAIDPVTSPSKVDDLITQVEDKYGGEVRKYKDFVNSFKGTIDQIGKIADPEVKTFKALRPPDNVDPDVLNTLRVAYVTIQSFPKSLADLQESLQKPLKQRPPDYKGAADAIKDGLGNLSAVLDSVVSNFTTLKSRTDLPPELAQYMTTSLPHYQEMKKLVDDSLNQAKGLGELKLDTLRTALRERNTILVMGEKEWRVIRYDQVWKQAGRTAAAAISDTPPRPRFAGEQQVTAAILALGGGGAKPKVAFVRAGGPPLTVALPFGPGAEAAMSDAAERLQLYNFDVVEKDLTGSFARQSQGMFPEASDEDLKSALWIVWDYGRPQPNPETGEGGSIAPQVAQHLQEGGSAIILAAARSDPMTEALAPWGVDLRADAVIVHEKIPSAGSNSRDIVETVLRYPYVFDLHNYGDHPLAKPLDSLEGLFATMAPVSWRETKGYHAEPLLPVPTAPQAPQTWGSTNFEAIESGSPPKFDPKTDVAGPVNAGVAVEKDNGGRLVVLAAGPFATNQWLELTAQQVDPNAPAVLRFPGNGELFTNSVFWAARQDTLIDISPAAMDIGRIRDMSPATLKAWRVGVLLLGLPACVVALGAGVYLKRRD